MSELSHQAILAGGRYRGVSLDGVGPETVHRLYRFMLRLRRLEEDLIKEYHPADEMRCPVHFCVGQEAVPAALSLVLGPADYLFSHHRSHGYFLAKGAPLTALVAELYGRETGANGGRAGSQDISWSPVNFYSGAILAGAVAIAGGSALGLQLQKKPHVVVAGFGEGATDEGVFWEAINYAALRRLPIVFVCENNRYATYSDQLKRQPGNTITARVAAFGLKTCALFGNDAVAVYRAVGQAVSEARAGNGPWFVEAYTYRWNGHVGPGDDQEVGYRSEDEIDFWRRHCPIVLLEEAMREHGLVTADEKDRWLAEIESEIAEALRFAKASPFPQAGDWTSMNYGQASPFASRLLYDTEMGEFDQNQRDAIPGPY